MWTRGVVTGCSVLCGANAQSRRGGDGMRSWVTAIERIRYLGYRLPTGVRPALRAGPYRGAIEDSRDLIRCGLGAGAQTPRGGRYLSLTTTAGPLLTSMAVLSSWCRKPQPPKSAAFTSARPLLPIFRQPVPAGREGRQRQTPANRPCRPEPVTKRKLAATNDGDTATKAPATEALRNQHGRKPGGHEIMTKTELLAWTHSTEAVLGEAGVCRRIALACKCGVVFRPSSGGLA